MNENFYMSPMERKITRELFTAEIKHYNMTAGYGHNKLLSIDLADKAQKYGSRRDQESINPNNK
ncbi:MAG: hypothetical protein OEX81_05875 [Candidatus Pacebacteria bacterium]|nr:hypothetical protein [Candidatus Paceibacterota bacterium]